MGLLKRLVHTIAHEKIGRGRGIVRFERESLGYRSVGLAEVDLPEIEAFVSEEPLVDEAGAFVKFVVHYILTKSARIKPGETFEYGFWLVRFVLTSAGRLAAWDLRPGTTNEFVPNVDLAVGYCKAQTEVCARVGGTDFLPPGGDELAGYDDAVLGGSPVELYRDPRVDPKQSGWTILSQSFVAGVTPVRVGHLYEITEKRPDLIRYLALPRGWHVDLRAGERITYQPDLSRS